MLHKVNQLISDTDLDLVNWWGLVDIIYEGSRAQSLAGFENWNVLR